MSYEQFDPCFFGPLPEDKKTAVWEVTKRCQLKCPHCCSNSGDITVMHGYGDMKTEKAFDYVDILYRNGVKVIYFSGGEPLLWEPLVYVVERARSYGMECCIATSGFANNKKIWKRLIELGVFSFHVSIDSYCAEKHDAFRGVPTAFERALNFIDYCKENKMTVVTSSMITSDLINNFDKMLDLLDAHNVDRAVLNFFIPLGRASSMTGDILTTEEKKQIAEMLKEKAEGRKVKLSLKRIYDNGGTLQKCPAATALIHIDAYGKVSPCSWIGKLWSDMVNDMTENVFESGLAEKLYFRIKKLTDKKCGLCTYNEECGRGCPVIAYFEDEKYDSICGQ